MQEHSIEALNLLDDQALKALDWKNLTCLNGRLLELHAEGQLGNEEFAKLPRKPILCIDQIERIDDDGIDASFTFPNDAADWAYDTSESLEMLFQDQLDQLVGFWGARKADGIGRALSSGQCNLHQSLDFQAGKKITYAMTRKKWIVNKATGTGTAIFEGAILDTEGNTILETKKVIVGILLPKEIQALREKHGGLLGVKTGADASTLSGLMIPVHDEGTEKLEQTDDGFTVNAIQAITPELWPLHFHFKGDPVVPGNFGTHGMITLLKQIASEQFGVAQPIFKSMATKKFSGMIFEDPKQIRFELTGVTQNEEGAVVAAEANLYLEDLKGELMIESPIYTFKKLTVAAA
jgi:3-hydroxymyristoyl/3-hydroxydecanoyl-(acyl carrier protein) dehydratase